MTQYQNRDKEIAIVAIAYNRPLSLKRLLYSLTNAEYFDDCVDLIISIDYSGTNEVYELAEEFEWKYGNKIIIKHPEKLGLRNHVLFCGNLTNEYKNICVFEDDIYVSPSFYNFTKQALKYYENDDEIAGISLYSHKWNYLANRPFVHIDTDSFDVFKMQQAQSWGQVWSKTKWDLFIAWYNKDNERDLKSDNFPVAISNWPNSSWLKYHMKYLIETNKYFVYPKLSLTTNFSDIGTHALDISYCYQVELETATSKKYSFPSRDDNQVNYDIYFENQSLSKYLGVDNEQLTIDLYAQKTISKKYLLTTKVLNFKILKTFGLHLRPHELNILHNIPGEDIFLYDTEEEFLNSQEIKKHNLKLIIYDVKTNSKKSLLKLAVNYYIKALKIKLNRLF